MNHPLEPFVGEILSRQPTIKVEELGLRLIGEACLQGGVLVEAYRLVAADVLLRMERLGRLEKIGASEFKREMEWR